jgi:2,5-diamino-6-(ribosylamino)-4(3H)-pyrimidinone 5'-phosphate reductase
LRLDGVYRRKWVTDRPRVVTWNITTLDGRIAASPSLPSWMDERWTVPVQAVLQPVDIGALHDTTMTLQGSNSFVARDAGPADLPLVESAPGLLDDFLPGSVMAGAERWMAVIDSRGRVPWTRKYEHGVHLIVLVSIRTPPGYLAFLREQEVPYLIAGEESVDLAHALRRLGETFQVETVVSDAGGLLNGALLRAGLVDEIDLQILPIVLGIADAPSIFESYGLRASDRPMHLKLLHQEVRPDGSLFLRFTPAE